MMTKEFVIPVFQISNNILLISSSDYLHSLKTKKLFQRKDTLGVYAGEEIQTSILNMLLMWL